MKDITSQVLDSLNLDNKYLLFDERYSNGILKCKLYLKLATFDFIATKIGLLIKSSKLKETYHIFNNSLGRRIEINQIGFNILKDRDYDFYYNQLGKTLKIYELSRKEFFETINQLKSFTK